MRSLLVLPAVLVFVLIFTGTIACEPNSDSSSHTSEKPRVITGAETLISDYLHQLEGRRIGITGNPTARVDNAHLLDTLLALNTNVTALFAPEHGFRGDHGAGEIIKDGVDQETGLPVFSLYGNTRKPTQEMLSHIDVMLFDIQDVGVRFYTYISTLGLVLEAAAEAGVEVWVLDRPNPLGGTYMAGWITEPEFKSFVGAFPIPVVHGMTIGELAKMMIGEGWIESDTVPELKVIPMENWTRSMNWEDTLFDWLPPSPNLPGFANALVYPGTCFFEGTNFSEGRGTPHPFLNIGSQTFVFRDHDAEHMKSRYPAFFSRVDFTPVSIPGKAPNPKLQDKELRGVKITPQIAKPDSLRPMELGLELLRIAKRNDQFFETKRFLYNLSGTRKINDFLNSDLPPESFWQDDIAQFSEQREPYLLYR